jgi:Uma2 family endonuclease
MNYKEDDPRGAILDGTLPEQTVPHSATRRRADRLIWTGLGHSPDPDKDLPSIVVEFVSSRLRARIRDDEEKRREYRQVGIQEYWIIDRFERIMTVVRKVAKGSTELIVKADESYHSPLLPGFQLPLARLFKAADDWVNRRKTGKPGKARDAEID